MSASPSAPSTRVAGRYLSAAALMAAGLVLSLITFQHDGAEAFQRLIAPPLDPDGIAGIVRPSSETTISADAPLRIVQVLVEPGQTVVAGEPMFVVDDREAREALPNAQLEMEDAQLEVASLEAGLGPIDDQLHVLQTRVTSLDGELNVAARAIATIPAPQVRASVVRAQAAYDLAARQLERTTKLATDGIVPAQAVDDARIGMRVAQDDLEMARRADAAAGETAALEASRARVRSALVSVEGAQDRAERSAALERARLRYTRAQAMVSALETRAARSEIDAPAGGTVADVVVAPGQRVTIGGLLARMADVSHLAVEVPLPSGYVPRLRLGDHARVEISAIGSGPREAVVRSIDPLPSADGTHRVVVSFEPPPGMILSGQAATVTFPSHR